MPQLKILTSWDDGAIEDVRLADLLAKYRLPAIFFIPIRWESYCSSKGLTPLAEYQFQEIARQFDMGSHTITHDLLTKIDKDRAKIEIIDSKKQLQDITGKQIDWFCYPRGYASDYHKELVRHHYTWGRSTAVGSIGWEEDKAFQSTSVHVYQRREYKDERWIDYATRLLGVANIQKSQSVYHVWGHSWEIDRFGLWDELETLFKELYNVLYS